MSLRFLITAGPTREYLDPVRFITNRSSGKMGFAIAEAAAARGHDVDLITGPVSLPDPDNPCISTTRVETTRQMYDAVQARIGNADTAIFAAAVCDYRPAKAAEQKMKKTGDSGLTLELEQTEDILGSARPVFGFGGVLVGFAAETNDVERYALDKLRRKQCDLLVANDVSRADIGFDRDENEIVIYFAGGRNETLHRDAKAKLAEKLVEIIEESVKGGATKTRSTSS